jgi:hypothetical protein
MTRAGGDRSRVEIRAAGWLALPAVLAAVFVVAVELLRAFRSDSELFVAPGSRTFVEALRGGEVEVVYAFLRNGADANQPMVFRDAVLTDGQAVEVSPLLIAVASRNENAVLALLGFGARPTLPQNARAVCLARDGGQAGLADVIVDASGPTPAPTCPNRPAAVQAPLLAYAEPQSLR